MAKWQQPVKHTQAGEPVSAGVASRAARALENRTEYLKERLDATALGRAIVDYDVPLDPDVLEGEAVYWNSETQRYERALAAVENDTASSTLTVSASADCAGLLITKKASTVGDVVLMGVVKLSTITNAIGDSFTAGRYYLSSADPGKLVKQRPPVTIAVCTVLGSRDTCDDDPWVIVNPQSGDFLNDHIHYRFSLTCRPAGQHDADAALASGRHTIEDADSDLMGWLPADDPSFAGKAPSGAVFGYNLAAHESLSRVWPPVPVTAAAILWDKGTNQVGATEVPLGRDGLVTINQNGIWWMSDCYGDVPWPATYTDSSSSSAAATPSSSSAECPREETMRVELVYVRMVFGTDRNVVTSLQPDAGQPIYFHNCEGEDATTGDLKAGLDLSLAIDPEEVYGAQVLKELGTGLQFKLGYVAEGLVAGDDSIVLSGTRQRPVDPDDEESDTLHQGVITVSVNLEPTDRELLPQIVRLNDAEERYYKGIPYIGLPSGRDSGVTLRINVPPAGLPIDPVVKMRVLLFGRATGTLPALTMTYRRLPTPSEPTTLPTTDTGLDFDPTEAITADDMLVVESESFAVEAGDTLLVTIERAEDAGYSGEVGLIRTGGILLGG